MILKHILLCLLFSVVNNITASSENTRSYNDILILTYKSGNNEKLANFQETARNLGYHGSLNSLDCKPSGKDCPEKLLKALHELQNKNAIVMVVNPDVCFLNHSKEKVIEKFSTLSEKVIVSKAGMKKNSFGLHLIADAEALEKFLTENDYRSNSLIDIIQNQPESFLKSHFSLVISKNLGNKFFTITRDIVSSPTNYEGLMLFHYKSKSMDRLYRFKETAKAFGYQSSLKQLDCYPADTNCTVEFLVAMRSLPKKKWVVMLLNPDVTLINRAKLSLVISFRMLKKKIVVYRGSSGDDSIGVQLIGDAEKLIKYLQDHAGEAKSLNNLIEETISSERLKKYQIGLNKKSEFGENLFVNIDGKRLGDTISMRYNYVPGTISALVDRLDQADVLVQEEPDNMRTTLVMDQLFNMLVHPQFTFQNELARKKVSEYPSVLLSIIVDNQSLFLSEFFEKLESLDFPRNRMNVYLSCQDAGKFEFVSSVAKRWKHELGFSSVKLTQDTEASPSVYLNILEHARSVAKSDFVLFVRSTAHIENRATLRHLLAANKTITAPLLRTYDKISHIKRFRQGSKKWEDTIDLVSSFEVTTTDQRFGNISNRFKEGQNFILDENTSAFWSEFGITISLLAGLETGENLHEKLIAPNTLYGARILTDSLWRVKGVRDCFLVRTADIPSVDFSLLSSVENPSNDALDDLLSRRLLEAGFAIHLLNQETYGQIVNMIDLPKGRLHPELYRIFENHDLWERRYITEKVRSSLLPSFKGVQKVPTEEVFKPGKCPDTYEVPMMTETFCDHLVEEAEHTDLWFKTDAKGSPRKDDRYGRQENVPTYDVALFQLGLEEMWLSVVNFYFQPMKLLMYPGLAQPEDGGQFFVIRYRPEEQPDLRPHEDSSLYTMNVALNKAGIDFEGGGTRFIRYNCSVPDLAKGHILVHPGKVTHYHEGLPTSKGTRYIMISFVNISNEGSCHMRLGKLTCDS